MVIGSAIPDNIMGIVNVGVDAEPAFKGYLEMTGGGSAFIDELWIGRNNWRSGLETFNSNGGKFDMTGGSLTMRAFAIGDNGVGQVTMTDGLITVIDQWDGTIFDQFTVGSRNTYGPGGQASVLLQGGTLDVLTAHMGVLAPGSRGPNNVPVGGNIHLVDGLLLMNTNSQADVTTWMNDGRISGEFGTIDRSAWEPWADYSNGALRADFDGDINGGRITVWAVPEPSTIILLAMGAVGLLAHAWRRCRRSC